MWFNNTETKRRKIIQLKYNECMTPVSCDFKEQSDLNLLLGLSHRATYLSFLSECQN